MRIALEKLQVMLQTPSPVWQRGADTWASLAVLTLKKENPALKLYCILPCEGQADKWLTSARELYFSILEQADEVVYVSREYHKGCMLERNRYPVNHAACLLADFIHTRACKLICEEFLTRPALRPAVNRFRKIEAIIQPIPGWLNE